MFGRDAFERAQGLLANAASGHADRTIERLIVLRIGNHPEPRQNILDLRQVKKAASAD